MNMSENIREKCIATPIPVQSYVKSPIKKKLFHEAWLLVYKTRKETT